MLPQVTELEFNQADTQQVTNIGDSFLFDFNKGDFVLKDGKFVKASDLEALKMWIEKVLRTEKFRFKIYDDTNYGITLEDLIGQVLPREFVEAELKRELKEALEKHSMIQSISNITTQRDGAKLMIVFKVNLSTGETFSQEVSI